MKVLLEKDKGQGHRRWRRQGREDEAHKLMGKSSTLAVGCHNLQRAKRAVCHAGSKIGDIIGGDVARLRIQKTLEEVTGDLLARFCPQYHIDTESPVLWNLGTARNELIGDDLLLGALWACRCHGHERCWARTVLEQEQRDKGEQSNEG